MRKLTLCVVLVCLPILAVRAQTFVEDLEKIKQIRLLVDTKAEVDALLTADTGFLFNNRYSRLNSHLTVYFSEGHCPNEREHAVSENDWEVPKGKAVLLVLRPKSEMRIAEAGINYSAFRREKAERSSPFDQVYFFVDKKKGIGISTWDKKLDSVFLFPSESSNPLLCKQKEVQEYYASDKWVRRSKSLHAPNNNGIYYSTPANVVALALDTTDLSRHRRVRVETTAVDKENEPITYRYVLSGGKIVGDGAKVVWDLAGVAPGTYSIIAGADDGDGAGGKYIKRTIVVE
jgi:hypothetical protein